MHCSALINSCPRARALFKTHTNESVKKPSAVRFVWLEMARQINNHLTSIEAIARHEDDFNPLTRKKLISIFEESYNDLKLELALIIDAGTDVVKLCYQQKGDGFLAPTACSHWQSVMLRLSSIADENVPIVERLQYLPITDAMLKDLIPIEADRVGKMKTLVNMVIPLHKKMVYNTKNRMESTLSILRPCRVFNYEFIGSTRLNALREEIEQLQRIPSCIRIMQKATKEPVAILAP